MKRKGNLCSVPEAEMSLSRFFKNGGDFIPGQLVPRPPDETEWHPVSIPEDRPCEEVIPEPTEKPPPRAVAETPPNNNEVPVEIEPEPVPSPPPVQPEPFVALEPEVPPVDLELVREEAFRDGVSEGLKQAEKDFGSATVALTQACELINNIRETILKNSKNEMIELIIILAEKIIRHSVTTQDDTILETVEEAILKAVKSSEFHIYLHPDDMAVIKNNADELVGRVSGLENIVVKTDPSIERGGCKVESENCTVDATLASQLDVIRNRIIENH